MDNEKIILKSSPISIASYENHKEAIFLISVLDEPDGYGRIIPKSAGEKYCDTILGYPIVAKLKKNIFGQPVDFCGHELVIEKTKDGKKKNKFNTIPIGSVIDVWIEEREVSGYEGTPNCILIKAKLWTSRFPEYFKVFDRLWEEGKISSSWELTANEVIQDGENKIYKVFEFIGNCILGSDRIPCVSEAGVLSYAEFTDNETELNEAIAKDISLNIDIAHFNSKEKKEENFLDKKDKKSAVANPDVKTDIASLTEQDLFGEIDKKCRESLDCEWGYIFYWFPEDHVIWYKPGNALTTLDYKVFTYSIKNDEVTVSNPVDAKLAMNLSTIDTALAEKDKKIEALVAENESKNQAVISAGEKINKLNLKIAELKPYREKVEKEMQEKIEAEIAEQKENLKKDMLKGGLFTEDEITKAEIAELIEARDKTAINNLIAERYIASFNKEPVSEDIDINKPAVASLETDDVPESPSAFMTRFLTKK